MNGHTSCPGCELELRTAAARCPRCGRWLGPVNRRFVVAVLVVVVLLLGAFVGLMRQQWIAQRASGMRVAEEAAQRQELERQRAQAQRAAERAGAERTAERVPPPDRATLRRRLRAISQQKLVDALLDELEQDALRRVVERASK